MGKRDLDLKSYLSDRRRYADIYNGSIFHGGQLLKPEELEPVGTVTTKADETGSLERTSDIVMRQKSTGDLYALWILENQETVDYSMPVRIMLKEAMEYDRQVKELKRENAAEYKARRKKDDTKGNTCDDTGLSEDTTSDSSGEYLYKVRKEDRIYPVNTLIVYWGKESWDGPKSLHDLLDFGNGDMELQKELKRLVPEYPLHILDLNEVTDCTAFQTELRTVFELYRCRKDKKEFKKYLENHEECRHLDEESCRIIGRLTNSEKLLSNVGKDGREEENMNSVIDELIEDGRLEGVSQGISQGIKALVETCKEFGCSKEEITEKLMKKLTLSKSEAEQYVEIYMKN